MIVWGGDDGISYSNTGGKYCVQCGPTPTPTPTASPTPNCPVGDYTITTGSGTIVPGTTDIGNHADDGMTTIALPFPLTFYGQTEAPDTRRLG